MERSFYTFDKRIDRTNWKYRLQIVICQAPDCRVVMHCDKLRGQQKKWCSNRCYARWRTRGKKGTAPSQYKTVRTRHAGVLGVAHYRFGG